MARLPNIGDWGFVTGNNRIGKTVWDSSYPKGIFGKVIDVSIRYSSTDGRKLPAIITMRCYFKKGRSHIKTNKDFYKPLKN